MREWEYVGDGLRRFVESLCEDINSENKSYDATNIIFALREGVSRVKVLEGFAVFEVYADRQWAIDVIRKDSGGLLRGYAKQGYGIRYLWASVGAPKDKGTQDIDAPASTAAPKADRRNVERVGRVLGDGSRRGARIVRRCTVYLGAELAQRLEIHSAMTGDQKSELVERAVAAYLDRTQAAGHPRKEIGHEHQQ